MPPHAQPRIAIVGLDPLSALGLTALIERLMPGAEVLRYATSAALMTAEAAAQTQREAAATQHKAVQTPHEAGAAQSKAEGDAADGGFRHYFVAANALLSQAAYFLQRARRVIVLTQGDERGNLPTTFHTLSVQQSEEALIAALCALQHHGHAAASPQGRAEIARAARAPEQRNPLTAREREVLCAVVRGRINKEIASDLCIAPATVITHRKNLCAKLGTRSVAALTIYAISHGYVAADEV